MTATNTTTSISEEEAFRLESIECNAWSDMYDAAPPQFARMLRIVKRETPAMTMIAAALPTGLFNKCFMHGLLQPLDEAQLATIKLFFAKSGAEIYQVYTTPFSKLIPSEQLLPAHGFSHTAATDKIISNPQTIPAIDIHAAGISVCAVDESNMAAWADFICDTYKGLPNQPWLKALVNRKGWYHAIAKRSGKIVACRSMYIHETSAWLGIDAPIPGIMTDDYLPDQLVTQYLLQTARENGVTLVNSCIEAVHPSRKTAAYSYLYELGFSVAYTRKLYTPG